MIRRSVLGLLACVPLLFVACGRSSQQSTSQTGAAPSVHSSSAAAPENGGTRQTVRMPVLKLPAINGEIYDLSAYRGKWVVVNFWATWCAPCLKEMPELSALHTMRENIKVVGLAYEDITVQEMQAFLQQHPVSYPVAILDPYRPPQDFATPRGLPMTYLIGPDGTVAKQFLGPVSAREIEAAVGGVGKAG